MLSRKMYIFLSKMRYMRVCHTNFVKTEDDAVFIISVYFGFRYVYFCLKNVPFKMKSAQFKVKMLYLGQ